MLTTLIILVLVLIGLVVALLLRQQGSGAASSQLNQQLQQTAQMLMQQMGQQQASQERAASVLHQRMDQVHQTSAAVQSQLSQLQETNRNIIGFTKELSSLSNVLRAPKLRGTMGEVWLQELISQTLPHDSYKMQYGFRTGDICDAVIFLRDGMLLPIDAKFSLENFTRLMEAQDDAERATHRKAFSADVKRRIDEIAKKYILPQEGTLEFAFMYVPAENVYYQAFIQDDGQQGLMSYAYGKRVVPVSPSSFQAYLHLILMGLKGMEIEKSAKEIQRNLAGLQVDFGRFSESHRKIGAHLHNAQSSFDDADKRLDKLGMRLETLAASEQQALESAASPFLDGTHAD